VVALQRIAVGPLTLAELKAGEFRELTKDEVSKLKSL
jgi:16S rRNA U516 pseudouridylate synthase RsuA-like enzyme